MRSRTLLTGLGIALIAASVSARVSGRWRAADPPGALKATQAFLEWQCLDPSNEDHPAPSMPTFEVVNVGGTTVRILSVKTSCGCASAAAKPDAVPPGGRSMVTVTMDPLEVGMRAATIMLETDAPSTPEVSLQVMETGYRRPPYLFQLSSGLYFHEGYSMDEPREVVVDLIAVKTTPEEIPLVTSDLPFLRFGPPTVGERPHVDPNLVVKNYRFPVRFVADPPDEAFSGRILVADPWINGRFLQSIVQAEANRPIRVAPSRLVLNVPGGGGVRFLARSNRTNLPLVVVAEDQNSPLVVKEVAEVGESGFRAFEISWRPGREVTGDVYNVIVGTGANSKESLTVPVHIHRREG